MMAVTAAAPTALAAMQAAWAAHLRAPAQAPQPAATDPARMQLYAQLVATNIARFMHQCFPVARSLLPAARWQQLLEDFLAQGSHTSPYFHQIAAQFVQHYHQRWSSAHPADIPPWLPELLHYEWLELAVDTAPDAPVHYGAQGLALSPSLQLAGYSWPVHTLAPAQLPQHETLTFIAVFRNASQQVRFSILTPAAAQYLHLLQGNACDTQAAAQQLRALLPQAAQTYDAQIAALHAQWLAAGLLRASAQAAQT